MGIDFVTLLHIYNLHRVEAAAQEGTRRPRQADARGW